MKPSVLHKLSYRAGRIRYRLQEEGIVRTLCSIVEVLSNTIFRNERALVYSRHLGPTQFVSGFSNSDGFAVDFLTVGEIDDLRSVSYASREEIMDRLAEGDLCLVARLEGRIAHYSWLTAKSRYAWEIERTVDLEQGQFYLYNCRTVRAFRGRGIYKTVIAKALEETRKRNGRSLAALIRRNNAGSRRAFETMGFEIEREILFQRVGTHRRYKEKSYANALA